MNLTVKGVYQNGMIQLLEPIDIEEGSEITLNLTLKRSFASPIRSEQDEDDERRLLLLRQWQEEGLIDEIPDFMLRQEHPPIQVKGKPVSELIIEDRGPR